MTTNTIPEGFVQLESVPGLYINKEGHVYNSTTGNVSAKVNKSKVAIHTYYINGYRSSFYLAKAVALLFVPIPKELSHYKSAELNIAYKDNDKYNVCASNLYWVASAKNKRIKTTEANGCERVFDNITAAWQHYGGVSYTWFRQACVKGFIKSLNLKIELIK